MKRIFGKSSFKRGLFGLVCAVAAAAGIFAWHGGMKPAFVGGPKPEETVRIGGVKVVALKIDPAQRQRVMKARQPLPAPVELWDTSGKGAEETIAADFLEKGDYEQRARQLRRQTLEWNGETAQALYYYLLNPKDLPGIEASASPALKNEIMDYAVGKDPDVGAVVEVFIASHQAAGQSPLIRDYLVQHLDGVYQRVQRENSPEQKKQAVRIENLLWKTASQPAFESATALLTLERIARADRAFAAKNKSRLERSALALLNHSRASDVDKVTALQVALRLDSPAALPAARKFAQAGASSIALKASALGVLGRQGSQQDADWLKKVADDKDSPVNTVAQHALEQLKKRLNS